ncbi:MFS transporter [Mycolicibacterium hippocampi]|uniref:Putative MFS-type transporter n=1 Tax=Mycolicibacterium hippocampi TaxID=659824 RepID=A0A850PUE9_9MYCO|nr:MFS transporter [Mycolicibacterium hippocampi]NVN52507.1 putative MFS-type transporter [Mycolicibacterium hippocampi]
MSVSEVNSPPGKSQLRSLRAACAGNILEWFDWTLYAIFSTYIASHFFDSSEPTSALLSTLAVFAAGFLARPLGGLVFGRLADARGRKFVLVATISTMSIASLAIALIPSYDSIGVWASVLLLLARLLQGLAHGGESGVAYTYVSEIAPPAKRGLWSSSVFFAVTLGVMLATMLGALFNSILGQDAVADGGWRYAFVLGAILGLFVLVLRRSATETEEFEATEGSATDEAGNVHAQWSAGRKFKAGILVVLLSCGHNCAYYIWAIFASSLAISDRGMDPTDAFTASLLAQAVALGSLVVCGRLSDRFGRRPMIIAFGVFAIVLFYPMSQIITDEPWTLFVAQAVGMSIWAMGAAMYPAFISELFPTRIRATSVAFATSVSVALFGGTAPYLLTWSASSGNGWFFWVWAAALAGLAIVGGILVKETRGTDLGTVQWPYRERKSAAERVQVKTP